ncbi:MAG: hypothetical protein ACI35W_04760 [Anaeroplasmataceae bacterium]
MNREKMPMEKRAKQFLPFDALKGLREAIRLKEIEHERILKRDISPDKALKISNTLINLEPNSKGTILYYNDGLYYEACGNIKLDIVNKKIKIDNLDIDLDDLFDIFVEE